MPRKETGHRGDKSARDDDAFLKAAIKQAKKEKRELERASKVPVPESEQAAVEKAAEVRAKIQEKLDKKKAKLAKRRLNKKNRVNRIMKTEDEDRDIDKGLASAAGARDMAELDEMIKTKDQEAKRGDAKSKMINKLSKTLVNKRGLDSMEDMKKLPQMLCELGPVETLRRLGVNDPKELAEFKSMMAAELDLDANDPTMDLEEMTRRFMAASTYEDVEERQRVVQSVPKLEKVTQEELLDTIDALVGESDELEEYMVQTHLRSSYDKLVCGTDVDPSSDV